MEIRLDQVTVDFPARALRALDQLSLRIDVGEQVALVGGSGAGKTTLLRVLLGAITPVAGSVTVGGRDPYRNRAELAWLRRRTGLVRQRDDLVRGVSARLNVLMGDAGQWRLRDWFTIVRGGIPHQYRRRLRRLAQQHGIEQLLDAPVDQLSGGQRQRVALLRALLPAPALLLADECTSGLDPERAAAVIGQLRSARATLLLTTHDLQIARQFPRIVALRDGRLVADGPKLDSAATAEIYRPPVAADGAPTSW